MLSWKILNFFLSLVALFVYCAVIERRHPPLFFLCPFIVTPQNSKSLCLGPYTASFQMFLLHGALMGSHYSWIGAHPVGTHWMFYASVKAWIDWHAVNSGFACMSCLVTLMGHRFLFVRDTLLFLFMFAILVRSYSLQYD